MREWSMEQFAKELASKAPVPGGGGASAFGGVIGCGLGSMVGNLTLGKKKYAESQERVRELMDRIEGLQACLMDLMEADAKAFEPLSKAYSLPKETPEEIAYKESVMAQVLKEASLVPLAIMEKACEMLKLQQELAVIGSRLAVSDVGVGVQFLRSAVLGASMNVFINTRMMKDREMAEAFNERAQALMEEASALADQVFAQVLEELRS